MYDIGLSSGELPMQLCALPLNSGLMKTLCPFETVFLSFTVNEIIAIHRNLDM